MKSYAPEVIADSSGKWSGNALRFATRAEAEIWVKDLSYRWISVMDTRVVESDDPVTYSLVNGVMSEVKENYRDEGYEEYDRSPIEPEVK